MRALRLLCMIVASLGLSAIALSGCGSDEPEPPPPPEAQADPTTVELLVVASPLLNPDANGRPSPVVVRLYELSTASSFNSSDFFQIYEQAEDTLGADLVATEELIIEPGDVRTVARSLKPETEALGMVVAYRFIGSAEWRAVVAVEPNEANPLTAELLSLTVSLAPRDSEEAVPAEDVTDGSG